jgi:3-oxoacyl-[acyl-carrier protein] reductase
MSNDLAGSVALVTGAGSGIGRATAIRLGLERARVGVNDVDETRAAETVELVVAAGGTAESVIFDVADPDAVDGGVDDFVGRHGQLDIMVNNAGFLRSVPGHADRRLIVDNRRADGQPGGSFGVTVNTSNELWRAHMSVLLDGVFFGTRAALRYMEPQGQGAIVNVSSVGAFHPAPDYPYYAAAKAAVAAFTVSVAHEVAGGGIRVNAVAPGTTSTNITAGMATGSSFARARSGRIGRPEEIAEVIVFLASNRASYCFGEIVTVSGAFS